MSDILFHYEKVNPTSWAYLSSLLMLALFFKFNRTFSVRNLDLFLLISLAPGLLLVEYGMENIDNEQLRSNALVIQRLGFQWLFAVGALLITRLLLDSAMKRRPLLPPNLNVAGLTFMGGSLLFFLMANVWTGQPSAADVLPAIPAEEAADESSQAVVEDDPDSSGTRGPGYRHIYLLPRILTQKVIAGAGVGEHATPAQRQEEQLEVREWSARVVAILSHVLIVVGMLLIGVKHFENSTAGVAAATMYLLLPYTALYTGSVDHCLPASLLVWAIVLYRRPLLAGMMVGLASGTIYYPAFLIPLWCSFYWDRGVKRFGSGALLTIGVLVLSLALTAGSLDRFFDDLRQMFGVRAPEVEIENLGGVWRDGFWNPTYRLPLLAAFVALAFSFVFWPIEKNLATLISGTAALMVGAQFWHAHGGGVYIAWYLPLLLLTVHRPNLEGRAALAVVDVGWWQARRRRAQAAAAA